MIFTIKYLEEASYLKKTQAPTTEIKTKTTKEKSTPTAKVDKNFHISQVYDNIHIKFGQSKFGVIINGRDRERYTENFAKDADRKEAELICSCIMARMKRGVIASDIKKEFDKFNTSNSLRNFLDKIKAPLTA